MSCTTRAGVGSRGDVEIGRVRATLRAYEREMTMGLCWFLDRIGTSLSMLS